MNWMVHTAQGTAFKINLNKLERTTSTNGYVPVTPAAMPCERKLKQRKAIKTHLCQSQRERPEHGIFFKTTHRSKRAKPCLY